MLLKASKVLYIMFIFYVVWFQKIFFQIPNFPLITGLGMIVFLIIHQHNTTIKASLVITKPVFLWLIFVFSSLSAGLFVASDKLLLLNSLFTYIQTLAMVIYIINISVLEKSNKFFVKSFLILSIIYMVTMLFWGIEEYDRLILSANSNPNVDGAILLFGVFCVLVLLKEKNLKEFTFSLGLIGLFVYTIILTGSRKSFLSVLLYLIIWFVFIFIQYFKNYSVFKKLGSLLTLTIVFFIISYFFIPTMTESNLFMRLSDGGYSISEDYTRSKMYSDAVMFFKDNPFFGIGFAQYQVLSIFQTYSHSTYAELISTTGVTGTVIYFSAYLIIIYNLIKLLFNKRGTSVSIKALQYLLLLLVMLVLGTGVIHFYLIVNNLMFALMISFYYVKRVT